VQNYGWCIGFQLSPGICQVGADWDKNYCGLSAVVAGPKLFISIQFAKQQENTKIYFD